MPKKDKQMINLRPLNQFLHYRHFKMEGIQVVKDILCHKDWLTRIDLKDAYFAIPIHSLDRKFLRFRWQKKSFQFNCLPFGLSSAPRVFTKALRPVIGYLRNKGVRCVVYIDDILLMHQDRAKLVELAQVGGDNSSSSYTAGVTRLPPQLRMPFQSSSLHKA